jgi:protein tyrosine phosphatase (PTP) superfamily phosphohydrolase (DUF442 family)
MNPDALNSIRNFRRLDERIATSGQPSEAQLRDIAEAGFRNVINLALKTSPGALPDEGDRVAGLGLGYVHIPVDFKAPAAADYEHFSAAMDARKGQTVFVHCIANYRVSAFMAIYRVQRLGWERAAALDRLREVWEPDEVWTRFLDEQLK